MVSFVFRSKWSAAAGILRFPFLSPCLFGRARMISAMSSDESPSRISPWLMLPPAFESGDTIYKFYNLAEDRVESFNKRVVEGEESPDADAHLVGSSHGWLAFFNQRDNHVFLSNPLSGRHLKLPPIHTLPYPEINLRDGRGTVSKVILSCSPDDKEEECRAMMSFGPGDRLAFCSPGRSASWTPIGSLFFEKYADNKFLYGRAYEDFVYCRRRKLFSCITEFRIGLELWKPRIPTELEDWDLRCSPRSQICYWLTVLGFEDEKCSWLKENKKLLQSCIQVPYLVFAEQCNQLFIVARFVDAAHAPYKTVGFSLLKVDYRNGLVDNLRLADSLDGLAMFIGTNHSFAVSAAADLGLKPNSIYFTDANARFIPPTYHGHDIGIFDYGNKTVSPCPPYCNNDDQISLLTPKPVWFTPNRY